MRISDRRSDDRRTNLFQKSLSDSQGRFTIRVILIVAITATILDKILQKSIPIVMPSITTAIAEKISFYVSAGITVIVAIGVAIRGREIQNAFAKRRIEKIRQRVSERSKNRNV